MSSQEEEFLRLLRATFKAEAEEHLQAMSAGLQSLEGTEEAGRPAIVETVYREAHSLKGAARAVNRTDVEQLCQAMETVFASWKRGETRPRAEQVAVLLRAADAAAGAVAAAAEIEPDTLAALVRQIEGAPAAAEGARAAPAAAESAPPPAAAAPPAGPDTVRIPTAKLDQLIRGLEEFLPSKMAAAQRAADLRDLESVLERWQAEWSGVLPRVRSAQSAADRNAAPSHADLLRLLEFADWNHHQLKVLEEKVRALARAAAHDRHEMDKRVGDILESSKKLALLPCRTVFAALPKTVRDICRDQGKEADLIILGGEIEVDKHILEELKDPLTHIVRNCVDHGIEPPELRASRGKPRRGTIRIVISQAEGNKIGIVIEDDGGGIQAGKLRSAAVANGLLSAEEAARLDDRAALHLIFESGVSTSAAVSEISGRGLGLAIVREKTEKLGGTAAVESQVARGTTFRLLIPLTRATYRGIIVQAEGLTFILPTEHMERISRVKREEIGTVENRETLTTGGRPTSLVHLADLLELEHRKAAGPELIPVIVLRSGDRRIALGVDEVLHETEVLVKPLGPPLLRVRNVSAATVLAGGQVVPVLNVADLMKSAGLPRPARAKPPSQPPSGAVKKGSILVVEDSITARMLLKNILEAAGHHVKTAVDGVDALTNLRTEDFDLVVSDVDMPRMNGLDLTARIRADRRMTDLPVILVTALASPADRERGAQVGANAYLVKSSFDQSNLLAAIERLL